MSEQRQNTCPKCGRYIWSHPVVGCNITPTEAQAAYDKAIAENRRQYGNPQT